MIEKIFKWAIHEIKRPFMYKTPSPMETFRILGRDIRKAITWVLK